MLELITNRFTFTVIIAVLYFINAGLQIYIREPLRAGYFFSAGVITVFTIMLMVYEKI